MVEIKKITDIDDFKALAAIQQSAWGFDDLHTEPHTLMTRVQKYGGLVQGLFLDRRLIGFSYAVLAKWQNTYFMYSHMTAICRDYAGAGYGFLLKRAQYQEVLTMGYDTIRWTYDPLEALNSFFNIHRLGAISHEYERNIYGMGDSGLHRGLATDRLVAEWPLTSARVTAHLAEKKPAQYAAIPETQLHRFTGAVAYIEIPRDIRVIKAKDMAEAIAWRMQTREYFETAFANGYTADEIVFDATGSRLYYKLRRP